MSMMLSRGPREHYHAVRDLPLIGDHHDALPQLLRLLPQLVEHGQGEEDREATAEDGGGDGDDLHGRLHGHHEE